MLTQCQHSYPLLATIALSVCTTHTSTSDMLTSETTVMMTTTCVIFRICVPKRLIREKNRLQKKICKVFLIINSVHTDTRCRRKKAAISIQLVSEGYWFNMCRRSVHIIYYRFGVSWTDDGGLSTFAVQVASANAKVYDSSE